MQPAKTFVRQVWSHRGFTCNKQKQSRLATKSGLPPSCDLCTSMETCLGPPSDGPNSGRKTVTSFVWLNLPALSAPIACILNGNLLVTALLESWRHLPVGLGFYVYKANKGQSWIFLFFSAANFIISSIWSLKRIAEWCAYDSAVCVNVG